MSKTNDGGPAFATQLETNRDGYAITGGMTIRDYFAAKALQGWLSNPGPSDETINEVAQWSYRMADAMLKARTE